MGVRKNKRVKPANPKQTETLSAREKEFSGIVANTLFRYKGKRYTVGLVKKLAEELNNAIVDYCCKEPSFDERIKELRKQLKHKAVLVSPHGANRHRGCFFVESVERETRAGCTDVVKVSGVLFTPEVSEGMGNAFVRPINYYFGIDCTCVRDGSLRTTYGGEYYTFAICTRKVYDQYRALAKATLSSLNDRLSNL